WVSPSVRSSLATRFDAVEVHVALTEPPAVPPTHATGTIGTTLPWPSCTMTLCGVGRAVLIIPVWLSPPFLAIWVGMPGSAVDVSVTGERSRPATGRLHRCAPD